MAQIQLVNPYYTNHACCRETMNCVNQYNTTLSDFFQIARTNCANNTHWVPQSQRMEAKYWPYINFVGHMETIATDAERLLLHVGAWEDYGAWGWGDDDDGNNRSRESSRGGAIFGGQQGGQGSQHATNALTKLRQYYTPTLEAQVDEFYANDYQTPTLELKRTSIFPSNDGEDDYSSAAKASQY